MTSYLITNNSDGSYKTPSLYIPNYTHTIKIVNMFIDKSYYLSNSSNPIICVHSKQLAKYLKVNSNSNQSSVLFCIYGNGITTENIIYDSPINLYFNYSSNVNKFDDFELKSIDGVALNLTTNSVRFQITIIVN